MAESMKSEEDLPVPGVSNALIERLFVYQQQRHLCDVLIITANGYIPAHRIVLVASCPYFNDIDSRQSYLSSSDTNFHLNFDIFDVKLIVKLLYTGKLSVTKENCWRIKKICQFLWLRSAIQVCDEFLSRNFCDENFENERIFSNDTTNFNSRLNICEQQENNCDVLESHMNNNSELNTNITSGYKKPAHAIINLTEDEEIYSQDIDKSSVISNSCSDVHNKQNHSSNINTVVENEEDFKFMEDMSSDENLPSEDKSTTDISEVKNYKSLKTAEEEKNSYQNLPYDSSDNSMATNQDDSTVQEDRSANIESDHSSICHDKKLEDPLQPFSASDENGEESDASFRVNKNKRIEDRKCSGELKEISTECALPLSISMLYHPVSSEQQCSIGYSCHECGESCADITKLIQHRRLKHPKIIKYNGCDLCNKQPRKGINLAEHKFKMHNIPFDEKRYQLLRCTVLGCTFNTLLKGHLKAHINGHSKESSFMCDICGKKFKTKFQLSRHKQIHSENRQKFVCYVCGHTFSSNCSLRFHIREIHEKKKKPLKLCHHCPYSCKGNLAFYNHLYKVHNEAPPDGKTM